MAEALRLCERALGRQQRSAAPNPMAAFEHLLGSAAVRGAKVAQLQEPEAGHWAHAEYGWALYKAGRLQVSPADSKALHSMHQDLLLILS